jgi:ATP-binding cassette subfamily B protein
MHLSYVGGHSRFHIAPLGIRTAGTLYKIGGLFGRFYVEDIYEKKFLPTTCFAAAAIGIRVLVKALFNEVYVPYNRNNIQRGMNVLLMEKSQKLDLRCLDTPEFYNKYTRALEQADSVLLSFVDNTASFFDRFVYISTVITIISTLDPVLIVFSVVSVIILFFFGKRTSAYRYNTTQKTTPVSRQADYSKRIHYLPEYAKDV